MLTLHENLANGSNSSVFKTTTNGKVWVRVKGTFAAATATIEESLDNSTFDNFVSDASTNTFTANGYDLFDLPGGVYFRLATAGGGGGTTLDIHISGTSVFLVS